METEQTAKNRMLPRVESILQTVLTQILSSSSYVAHVNIFCFNGERRDCKDSSIFCMSNNWTLSVFFLELYTLFIDVCCIISQSVLKLPDNDNNVIFYLLQSKVSCFYNCNNNSQNKITHTNRKNNMQRLRRGMTFVVYRRAGSLTIHAHACEHTLKHSGVNMDTHSPLERLKNLIGI